jgi:diaminopimelate decarboxylase
VLSEFGDIEYLANNYGTPLIVYAELLLQRNVELLRNSIPSISSLAYSIKANPNPSLLHLMNRNGLMAEAASEGELALALKAGVSPEKLLLGGPAKTLDSVALAVDEGLCAILVESLNDLKLVRSVAKDAGRPINILLRVNPICLSSQAMLRMTGVPSPFGIDEEQLPEVLRACEETSARYAGLFLYAGSQHFSADDIVANTRYLCFLAARLVRDGFPAPQMLDFGGGFGVSEDESQHELDLKQLRNGLTSVFEECVIPLTGLGLRKTVFESGRYLVSRSGIFITRIMDIKRSRGTLFAILDGGVNNLGIRQLLYRTFEPKIDVLRQRSNEEHEMVTLIGPTCTPIDIVHKGCELPELQAGDLIVIRDFGAYTTSYSAIHFCGHPWPAEVILASDGTSHLLRRRGLLDESCGMGYLPPADWKRETTG